VSTGGAGSAIGHDAQRRRVDVDLQVAHSKSGVDLVSREEVADPKTQVLLERVDGPRRIFFEHAVQARLELVVLAIEQVLQREEAPSENVPHGVLLREGNERGLVHGQLERVTQFVLRTLRGIERVVVFVIEGRRIEYCLVPTHEADHRHGINRFCSPVEPLHPVTGEVEEEGCAEDPATKDEADHTESIQERVAPVDGLVDRQIHDTRAKARDGLLAPSDLLQIDITAGGRHLEATLRVLQQPQLLAVAHDPGDDATDPQGHEPEDHVPTVLVAEAHAHGQEEPHGPEPVLEFFEQPSDLHGLLQGYETSNLGQENISY